MLVGRACFQTTVCMYFVVFCRWVREKIKQAGEESERNVEKQVGL